MRRVLLPLFCLLTAVLHAAPKHQPADADVPQLRVSKVAAAPTIDGSIEPGEWADAAAVTGFAAVAGVGSNTLVPEMQQVVWYIGYDDTHLYLAMHSPHAKGTWPAARIKEDENMGILFEDHVEIQITPHQREQAGRQGFGFYKVMINPKGAMTDWHYYNGTIGTEHLWSIGGERACHVTDESWSLELSIELARMQVKKLDGRSLIMQLVRTDSCAGIYYAGWVPTPWMAWNTFPEVHFDPQAPTFQFRRLGEVMEGNLDASIELTGNGTKPTEVTVEVIIEDEDGKPLHSDTGTATVNPGESQLLSLAQSGIPVTPGHGSKRNHFLIKATYKDGSRTRILYQNRLPFIRLDDHYRETYLDPWSKGRPQSGEWEYTFAWQPYHGKAAVGVDVDFFGMPDAIRGAAAYTVSLRAKGSTVSLADFAGELKSYRGHGMMSCPALAEGEYEALFRLLDGKGGLLSEKVAPFVCRNYPFEHNQLGITDEVLPPFTPLVVRENATVQSWGAATTVGDGGLPAQILQRLPSGNAGKPEALLAAPMRLELLEQGASVAATEGSFEIVNQAMHQVDVAGSQSIGPLTATIQAREEYDSWYQVALTLAPTAAAAIDALDLVVELKHSTANPVDTLYIQRKGDGRYGNHFGGIPAKPGLHFQSTELIRHTQGKDWKSFVPRTYVGNGDRGLWFHAWTDKGWQLADDQACIRISRLQNGNVELRIRLLAGPITVEDARTLHFAIQPAPVKPNERRYRVVLHEEGISHDTRGYRYWGDSVDSFSLPLDGDVDHYEELRKTMVYGTRYQDEKVSKLYNWFNKFPGQIVKGMPIVMYGSTWMTGLGAPEFETYGGEWLRKSNWTASPDNTFRGKFNYSGSVDWDTDTRLTASGVNWTRSFTDFFVYYHDKLIDKAGFNGTWWDNSSIGTIDEYDPELDRMDAKWNTLYRRDLCRRLNAVGWKHVRKPYWAMNMHTDFSWNQIFWMVENDWYCDAPDLTSLQSYTLDEFRAMSRTKSTMLIAKPWLSGFSGTTPELNAKIQRSVTAICLSHDISAYHKELLPKLQYKLAYGDDTACEFIGYWRTGELVQTPDSHVTASIYRNERAKHAIVLLFNVGIDRDRKDRAMGGMTFDADRIIGARDLKNIRRIYDFESGETIQTAYRDGRFEITEPFRIPWHEYRIIGIEGE